ncbi:alpha-L-rhamnosidase C-terminal domain-containing protein [Blautia sp. TF12-12AT]|uniref:alpha-L-rhamnosidase C-terminal domain-containing protein n=1 Tax=Blautia sp. TF12-12AT TaxID=2292988 RepID=UPI00131436F0|nr:alpha-L-rhamnosidase C-terminal domain-containing protein [Blautia sp. TF12-12AT]
MRISPKVNNGLKYVKAVYDSASGCYQCGWEISEDNKITVTVTVPFGGSAEWFFHMRRNLYMKIKKIHYLKR